MINELSLFESATEEEQKKVREVYSTLAKGGPFAHNLVGMSLNMISQTNKALANEVYNDIQEEGLY